MDDLKSSIEKIAHLAKSASAELALTSTSVRDDALVRMSKALIDNVDEILAANKKDVDQAKRDGVKESLIDRLLLTSCRIKDIANALLELKDLPDPVGKVREERVLYNGLILKRVSVPIGVVGMIYEARPNVTADAAGICIKSGNAVILRGGSMAANTNEVMTSILATAATCAGLPEGSIQSITTIDRTATDMLMQLHGLVDVIIPRGGAGLISHCVEVSKVPVIETGTGNCHVYVEASANLDMARDILINAKCRRLGVCNAAESLLIDECIAADTLALVVPELCACGIELHLDEAAYSIVSDMVSSESALSQLVFSQASDVDWETEYLGPELAIKCVSGVDEAISHINQYGTHHSEAIVSTNEDLISKFLRGVDAAAVYANASTAFTDGGQFGLGAEIGISTQKLHARGPFALDALTSYKYVIIGEGQTRE